MDYEFPFEVPADLSTLDVEQLTALATQVREHAASFAGLSSDQITDDTLTALQACRDLSGQVRTELASRRRAAQAAALTAEIDQATELEAEEEGEEEAPEEPAAEADVDGEGEQDGEGEEEPPAAPAVTASTGRRGGAPGVRRLARRAPTPQLPQDADRRYAVMTAAADLPNFSSGQRLDKFADAAAALAARLDLYPTMTAARAKRQGDRQPVTAYDPSGRRFEMRNYARHSAVQIRRDFPEDQRVTDGENGYAKAEYVASERRLPGGSLVESAKLAAKNGRSLTAAAGWCAPSDVIYDLVELETLDGILDVPELQTPRGGWQIPENGGPDFGTIYNAIGNAGDTHLSEADVIADTAKVSTDIPCPPFDDVRLGVDYVALTGGLLQRRGYPEVVARWSRAAVTALMHKINKGVIGDIVAGSGAATVIPADPSGDDAISAVLAAVDLAITDAKYRNRMGFNATLEVVLPMWVLNQIRAAATRRNGVDMTAVNEARIMAWFTERYAVPRFVYDWQDAFSGLATGPGGAAALTALPTTVDFLVYPAGTWVKAVQDVVSLDTIYDSTKLQTNEYTAIFTEDGWAALKMGPTSRLYRTPVDPSGVVGCCPSTQS